jgi:hypothetical protein
VCVAAQEGDVEVIKVLTAVDADLNQMTADGRRPIFIAAQKEHAEVVPVLGARVVQM